MTLNILRPNWPLLLLGFTFLLSSFLVHCANAWQQDDLSRSTKRTSQRQTYDLRYKLKTGDVLRWRVEQIASTDVYMAGYSEKSSLRTLSVIRWDIKEATDDRIKCIDQLESVSKWQRVGDAEPISFDLSLIHISEPTRPY